MRGGREGGRGGRYIYIYIYTHTHTQKNKEKVHETFLLEQGL